MNENLNGGYYGIKVTVSSPSGSAATSAFYGPWTIILSGSSTAPQPVTDLSAKRNLAEGTVTLTFTDPNDANTNVTYKIEAKDPTVNVWFIVDPSLITLTPTEDAGQYTCTFSYEDATGYAVSGTGLGSKALYNFRVTVINANGSSASTSLPNFVNWP